MGIGESARRSRTGGRRRCRARGRRRRAGGLRCRIRRRRCSIGRLRRGIRRLRRRAIRRRRPAASRGLVCGSSSRSSRSDRLLVLPRQRGLDGSDRDDRIAQCIGSAHQQVPAAATDAIITITGVERDGVAIAQIRHRLRQLDQEVIVVGRVYQQGRGIDLVPSIDIEHPYAVIFARQGSSGGAFGLPTARIAKGSRGLTIACL